ncbi:MAG: response regulator [Anaerolineales bacterium]|nr:response regulator [Anaerolineales bacterium]
MNPISILIVEDELLLAEVIRAQLSKCGYEIIGIETTGESTLRRMAKLAVSGQSPDIVLTNIKLSGKIDGIQTAEEINKHYGSAVIFLTGFYDPEMFERSIATKPYAYLLKPFDVQQAEATIRIAIYQRQLELDLQARQTELEMLNRELELRVQERIDYTTHLVLNSVQSELQGWVQRRSYNAANSNGPIFLASP